MRGGRVAAVVAGVVALGLVLSAVGAGVILGDPRADDADDDVELSEEARELERLLDRGRNTTFHASYDAVVEGISGNAVTIETWRKDGDVRQDMVVQSGDQQLRTATIDVDGERTVCTQTNNDPWQCRPEASAGDPLVGAVRERLAGGDVLARDDTIDGQRVRCFTVTPPSGDTSELCSTKEGVPVRVTAGKSRLELTALERDVDPSVFSAPATA